MKKIYLLLLTISSLCCYAQEFSEDFEEAWITGTGPNTGPPGGWGVYENGSGVSANWVRSQAGSSTQPAYEGDHAAYLDKENVQTGTAEDWLVTPQFTAPANAQIRFFSRLTTPLNDGSIYEVRISDAPLQQDLAEYEVLQTWTETQINPTYDLYTEKVVDIPAQYFGLPVYVALVMRNDNGDRWLVDNFRIVEKCLPPTALTVPAAGIGLNSVQLTWTDVSDAAQWEIEVVPIADAFTNTGDIYPTPQPVTISGLDDSTTYKVRMRALCGDGLVSDWSIPINFTTQFAAPDNDECSAAVTLAVNAGPACAAAVPGYVNAATASAQGNTCMGVANDDVWYQFTAQGSTHIITLSNVTGGDADLVHAVYEGTCTDPVLRYCSDANTSNAINLAAGETYYIRVYSKSATAQNTSFSICVTTPPPPPANDNCANAVNVPVNTTGSCVITVPGTVYSATPSPEPNTCDGIDDDDVWFEFTATSIAHNISLTNIQGSAPNLFHSVYSGDTCGSLVQMYCSNPESSIATGLTIGETYKVRVYSFTGTSGQTSTFDICISTAPPAPVNDNCGNAVVLTVNPALECTTVTAGTIEAATPSPEANTCGGNDDDDVWYQFTATATSHTISLQDIAGSTNNLYHAVYGGTDCGTLTQLYCSDPNTSTALNLVVGQTYKIRVYTFTPVSGQTTTFNICIGTPPLPPANDNCDNAVVVPVYATDVCTQTVAGTLLSATASAETNSCGGSADDDVWFEFTASGPIHFVRLSEITGSTTDLYHAVYTGNACNALSQLYCSDDNASVATGLTAGTTYKVRVYSTTAVPGQNSTFKICISTPPPPPANDECANAFTIPVSPGLECTAAVQGTVYSATQSPQENTCNGTADDDVWFEFTATATLHAINLTILTAGGSSLNYSVYQGDDCNNFTLLYCNNSISSLPSYLDVGKKYRIRVYSFTDEIGQTTNFEICVTTPVQPIITDNSYTVPQLVEDKLIGSSCAQVNNISWKTGATEDQNGLAYFTKGISGFPIEEGIILSTGNAYTSRGPNISLLSAGEESWPGDAQLFNYMLGLGIDQGLAAHFNATVLEFDFVPLTDHMSFPFIFASEEYGEFQCTYSDAFAFFLTNTETGETTNLAVLPGTDTPISVVTIRDDANPLCEAVNAEYYGQNNEGLNRLNAHIDFNGQTVVLTAESDVSINTVYHIKLVIADRNDNQYDSAVFIGPFDIGNIRLGEDLLVDTLTALCEGETHTIESGVDTALYTIKWFHDGVEIPGETSPNLFVNEPGTYTIEAFYLPSSCTSTESIVIEYYEPVAETTNDPADLVLCNTNGTASFDLEKNDEVILEGLSAGDYALTYYLTQEDAENSINALQTPYSNTTPQQTLYVRIDNNIIGCYAIKSFQLIAKDLNPEFEIEEFCDSDAYILRVVPVNGTFNPDTASYEWEGPDSFTSSEREIDIDVTGEYIVTVITAEGCELSAARTVTNIGECNIPRGVSPDNDGYNDSFDLSGLGVTNLSIFNRYGLEVYSYNGNYTDQWHGQSDNGDELSTGTYFYTIERSNGGQISGWVYINTRE